MTVVRRFQPEVRLKKLLAEPGGITAAQALERAGQGLDDIRAASLTAIDEKLERLAALAGSDQSDRVALMYKCANEVFAESGAFGLIELSAAAHSLCSLLSAADAAHPPTAAVLVHIDAMRALRRPDVSGDKAARAAVLSGLRGLAKRQSGG